MIRRIDGERPAFVLDTDNTTYAFAVLPSGHLEHLYYGKRIGITDKGDLEPLREKHEFEPGNGITYSTDSRLCLEDIPLEFSSHGHGDIREPFVEIVKPSGSRAADFLFQRAEIDGLNPRLSDLPRSYGGSEHLLITLVDGELKLRLHYCVYPECDVITRSAELVNSCSEPIELERLLSLQLDIPEKDFCVTAFHGTWAREMSASTCPVPSGKHVIESLTGTSSSRANPFFMLHRASTTERTGECYGFNLIYSGNHYECIEVNAYGKTRVATGVNPTGFRYLLQGGESFDTPEAVMTYSDRGFSGQSENMHRFVRAHILRGEWKDKPRPVLLNSWEASYFNISEHNLAALLWHRLQRQGQGVPRLCLAGVFHRGGRLN